MDLQVEFRKDQNCKEHDTFASPPLPPFTLIKLTIFFFDRHCPLSPPSPLKSATGNKNGLSYTDAENLHNLLFPGNILWREYSIKPFWFLSKNNVQGENGHTCTVNVGSNFHVFRALVFFAKITPFENKTYMPLYVGNRSSIVKITPTWNVLPTFLQNFPQAKMTTFTVYFLYMDVGFRMSKDD